MAGRGPYQLDPFTWITAIHFPDGGETILDFVNDKYRVAGMFQQRAEVIDHPEWRSGADGFLGRGLDLVSNRTPTIYDLDNQRIARIVNAAAAFGTDHLKGAFHEFAKLGTHRTVVYEFEWLDRLAAVWADHPDWAVDAAGVGFYDPDRFMVNRWNGGGAARVKGSEHLYELMQGGKRRTRAGEAGELLVGTDDYDLWYWEHWWYLQSDGTYSLMPEEGADPSEPDRVEWGRLYNYEYPPPAGETGIGTSGDTRMVAFTSNKTAGPGTAATFLGFLDDAIAASNAGFGNPPQNGPSSWQVDDTPPYDFADIHNAPVLYDTSDASSYDPASPYRMANGFFTPGDPSECLSDIDTPEAGPRTVPYGIVRVAMTIGETSIALSVNGSDVVMVAAAQPGAARAPNVTFPAFPDQPVFHLTDFGTPGLESGQPSYANHINLGPLGGYLRCIWLKKTRYTAPADLEKHKAWLKGLSVVTSPSTWW